MNTFVNRQLAIEKTLFIESLTSKLIKYLIGLDLDESTKSLDNKSSSISLKSKIDLLTDCGKIDKETYSNLMHIISIRNQFAHNFECNYFEDLLRFIDGIEKPLLKYCLQPTEILEDNLKMGFLTMISQSFHFLVQEFDGVTEEHRIDIENLKVFVSKSEEELLDKFGIVGQRNRAIVINKLREFLNEEVGDEKDRRIQDKLLKFIKEDPSLR